MHQLTDMQISTGVEEELENLILEYVTLRIRIAESFARLKGVKTLQPDFLTKGYDSAKMIALSEEVRQLAKKTQNW